MKQQWRTESIRINPDTRRAIALQGRFPITTAEWDTFMAKLEELKPQLVDCPGYDDESAEHRCGKHHFTELGNIFGGYNCCCGKNWTVDGCSSTS